MCPTSQPPSAAPLKVHQHRRSSRTQCQRINQPSLEKNFIQRIQNSSIRLQLSGAAAPVCCRCSATSVESVREKIRGWRRANGVEETREGGGEREKERERERESMVCMHVDCYSATLRWDRFGRRWNPSTPIYKPQYTPPQLTLHLLRTLAKYP